jgi:hypothetical protein
VVDDDHHSIALKVTDYSMLSVSPTVDREGRADAGATRATDGEAANSDRSDGSGTVVSNRRFTYAVTTLWVSNTRTLQKRTRFRP